jgi:hypothetical protein
MQIEWVTKLDVARRQTIEAIKLFFEERDPVAVHTITAAAHQVLTDVARHRNLQSIIKDRGGLKSEALRRHINNVNLAYNFFKHADRDPEGRININPLPEITEDLLMDAVYMLQALCPPLSAEGMIFWTWFVSKRKEDFENLPDNSETRKMQEHNLGVLPFSTIRMFIDFWDILNDIEEASISTLSNKKS